MPPHPTPARRSELGPLGGIAATLGAACASAFTPASALFLDRAGSAALPWTYVGMGLGAIALSTVLARWIDRVERRGLVAAVGCVLCAALLLLTAALDTWPAAPHVLFVVAYCQWIVQFQVLLPTLCGDYLTPLAFRRHSTALALWQTGGTVAGSTAVTLLAGHVSATQTLALQPVLLLLLLLQLRRLRPVAPAPGAAQAPGGARLTLGIVGRYPIISLLATATVVFVLLFNIAEYQYLTLYHRAFPDERALTRFLGLVAIASDLLQLALLLLVARPLMRPGGLLRLNLAYPLATFGAFGLLALSPGLATAVLLHLNCDPMQRSLNTPVQVLLFNAVPAAVAGRVRTICSGWFDGLAIVLSGLFLLAAQAWWSPGDVAWAALLLAGVFVALRFAAGRNYVGGLLENLRAQVPLTARPPRPTPSLDRLAAVLHERLPADAVDVLRRALESEDTRVQASAIEALAALDHPPARPLVDGLIHGPGEPQWRGTSVQEEGQLP